jgi:hypothetical protein
MERKRAAELAAAAAMKRESEKEARLAAERTLQPAPVAPSIPKQKAPAAPAFAASANVRNSRVRSRLAKAHSAGRQLRTSPAFALKFGAAVGLVGMVLLIAYANRRAPSPVGLGELTRSTTVQQSAPFGSAEIKSASAQSVVPGTSPSQEPASIQARIKRNDAKPSVTKPRAPEPDDSYDEPEVVVRHHTPAQRKPVINTAKDDGIKRFSDLD